MNKASSKNNKSARNSKKKNKSARRRPRRTPVTTSVPQAVSTVVTGTVANTSNTITISRRENLAEGYVTKLFTLAQQPITPINPSLFPSLCNIAPCYNQYMFNSLRFEYVPSCATTTSGTVAFAVETDVDALATGPQVASIPELLNNRVSVAGAAYERLNLTFPTKFLTQKRYYTAATNTALDSSNAATRQNVVGALITASDHAGTSDGLFTGWFYVSYSITFFEFQPPILQNVALRTKSTLLWTANQTGWLPLSMRNTGGYIKYDGNNREPILPTVPTSSGSWSSAYGLPQRAQALLVDAGHYALNNIFSWFGLGPLSTYAVDRYSKQAPRTRRGLYTPIERKGVFCTSVEFFDGQWWIWDDLTQSWVPLPGWNPPSMAREEKRAVVPEAKSASGFRTVDPKSDAPDIGLFNIILWAFDPSGLLSPALLSQPSYGATASGSGSSVTDISITQPFYLAPMLYAGSTQGGITAGALVDCALTT